MQSPHRTDEPNPSDKRQRSGRTVGITVIAALVISAGSVLVAEVPPATSPKPVLAATSPTLHRVCDAPVGTACVDQQALLRLAAELAASMPWDALSQQLCGGGIVTVSEHAFERQVMSSEQPVLVDFSAPWCLPCRKLKASLKGVAKTVDPEVVVAQVNIDHNRELAERFGVHSVPTMILFHEGQVRWRANGIRTERSLLRTIARVLNRPASARPPTEVETGAAD